MITIPNGIRLVPADPKATAMGSAPNEVASVSSGLALTLQPRHLWLHVNLSCPCFPFLVGKFHDQDTVLGHQSDQHDNTDL